MGVGIKRTQRDDTMAFKLAVIAQVEHGELTYKEAQHGREEQEESETAGSSLRPWHPVLLTRVSVTP